MSIFGDITKGITSVAAGAVAGPVAAAGVWALSKNEEKQVVRTSSAAPYAGTAEAQHNKITSDLEGLLARAEQDGKAFEISSDVWRAARAHENGEELEQLLRDLQTNVLDPLNANLSRDDLSMDQKKALLSRVFTVWEGDWTDDFEAKPFRVGMLIAAVTSGGADIFGAGDKTLGDHLNVDDMHPIKKSLDDVMKDWKDAESVGAPPDLKWLKAYRASWEQNQEERANMSFSERAAHAKASLGIARVRA